MMMTVGTMTNLTSLDLATEMEAEAEINAIMSLHRMHGMRPAEMPVAVGQDSRGMDDKTETEHNKRIG